MLQVDAMHRNFVVPRVHMKSQMYTALPLVGRLSGRELTKSVVSHTFVAQIWCEHEGVAAGNSRDCANQLTTPRSSGNRYGHRRNEIRTTHQLNAGPSGFRGIKSFRCLGFENKSVRNGNGSAKRRLSDARMQGFTFSVNAWKLKRSNGA
jgi:hypothetical protein